MSVPRTIKILQFLSVLLLLQIHFHYCSCLLPCTSTIPPQWCCGPTQAMASSCLRFLDHTQRLITVGRTPLDKWSAHRRDLYLTTHTTHSRLTSMPPVGFEPTSAGEWPQTYALDRMATGTSTSTNLLLTNVFYTTSHHYQCKAADKKNSVHCNSHTVCMEWN